MNYIWSCSQYKLNYFDRLAGIFLVRRAIVSIQTAMSFLRINKRPSTELYKNMSLLKRENNPVSVRKKKSIQLEQIYGKYFRSTFPRKSEVTRLRMVDTVGLDFPLISKGNQETWLYHLLSRTRDPRGLAFWRWFTHNFILIFRRCRYIAIDGDSSFRYRGNCLYP